MMAGKETVVPIHLKTADSSDEEFDAFDLLPEQPTTVAPIYDPVTSQQPLAGFSEEVHSAAFGDHLHLDSEIQVPSCPETFADPYVYPTLTQNEHTRLTMLWYYTRGLNKDKTTLRKLDQIVDLIKQSLGWEIGILGLVDSRTFTRLVTVNASVATIPRRESTCSHTINQQPGTIFTLTDMSQDWRFQNSPAVARDGLRSYAGTQIRLKLANGEEVVFGSLCVASATVQQPLNHAQKKSLIRAANMIAGELAARNRLRRLRERQSMLDDLNHLRSVGNESDIEAMAIQILLRRYPDTRVGITKLQQNELHVEGKGSVPFSNIEAGLWEDTDFIKACAQLPGISEQEIAEHAVRAVIGQVTPGDRFLIVSSTDMRFVFDDLDAWFVDQSAQIVNTAMQAYALKEALAAKEKFLRTITHELRTPIHGILSSVELINEDLKARKLLRPNPLDLSSPSVEGDASLNSLLQTIRSSGTELMTTVNNILRLNTLTNDTLASYPTDYDLRVLEADILGEVFSTDIVEQCQSLSIRFERAFDDSMATVRVDADLLRELLKCLVCNAIAATRQGTIEVLASIQAEDKMLCFDVIDSGTGISETDQARIFQAFEKLDVHSKGAGLGLSLASQMAAMLKGQLSLVSSQLGVGSHFRLKLPHLHKVTRPTVPIRQASTQIHRLPSKYHVVARSNRDLHLLSHLENHLLRRGLEQSDDVQGSLIITNEPDPLRPDLGDYFGTLEGPHIVLVITDSMNESAKQEICDKLRPSFAFPIAGPLFTGRIDEILVEVSDSFSKHCKSVPLPYRIRAQASRDQLQPIPPIYSNNIVSTPPATPGLELGVSALDPVEPRVLNALLVDDNIINLKVLQLFCKKRNIRYSTADNGHKAITSYCGAVQGPSELMSDIQSTGSFTLILMDLQMPECDGVEAVKRIRQFETDKQLQPSIIFMITGQDSVNDRKNSYEAGVDDFFVKPVSMKKLDRAISQYFPMSAT